MPDLFQSPQSYCRENLHSCHPHRGSWVWELSSHSLWPRPAQTLCTRILKQTTARRSAPFLSVGKRRNNSVSLGESRSLPRAGIQAVFLQAWSLDHWHQNDLRCLLGSRCPGPAPDLQNLNHLGSNPERTHCRRPPGDTSAGNSLDIHERQGSAVSQGQRGQQCGQRDWHGPRHRGVTPPDELGECERVLSLKHSG